MTSATRIIEVDDLGKHLADIRHFCREFPMFRKNALKLSLELLRKPVWNRTPSADPNRYNKTKYGKKSERKNPIVSGALRKAFRIDMTGNSGDAVSAEMGFKGIPYAERVHEMEISHYWSPNNHYGGGWSARNTNSKFLEKPIEDANVRNTILGRMADEIDGFMERMGL